MAMALSLFHQQQLLTLVVAYENGLAVVAQLDSQGWTKKYHAKPHSQPILSLDISPSKDYFLTSSADAVIAKHPLPMPAISVAGNGGVGEKPDAREPRSKEKGDGPGPQISALSAAFAAQPRGAQSRAASNTELQTEPLKVITTKHAGQQGLCMRSDGRIFATAGWDAKIRVYSSKTMKEVAVLKWHQVGCYAAAFAEVGVTPVDTGRQEAEAGSGKTEDEVSAPDEAKLDNAPIIVPKLVEVTLKEKRVAQAKTTHWLAAGGKDGKVSLWDVF